MNSRAFVGGACARRRLNGFCLHFDLPLHWFGASGGFAGGAQSGGGGACRLCAAGLQLVGNLCRRQSRRRLCPLLVERPVYRRG